MVVIRLSRAGAKKSPFYHIVATDKRASRDGRFIEQVGYYNPMARGNDQPLHLDQERVAYWLGQGAQASERVAFLLKAAGKGGLQMKDKSQLKPKAKAKARAKAKAEAAQTAETSAEQQTPAAE